MTAPMTPAARRDRARRRPGWPRPGCDSPRADAEVLAAYVHGVKRGELHTGAGRRLRRAVLGGRRPPGGARAAPAHHRAAPTSATWNSRSGPACSCRARRPRSMAGWAIDRLRAMDVAEPVVVDLGTGSGAIALAIAQEVPRARVHAVEADPLARAWAERNIAEHVDATRPGPRCTPSDFAPTRCRDLDGTVDLVVSNPPYIPLRVRVRRARGPRLRPDRRAVVRRGRPRRDPRRRAHRAAAAAPRRPGRRRARRPQGAAGLLDLRRGARAGATPRDHQDLTGRDRFVTARLGRGMRTHLGADEPTSVTDCCRPAASATAGSTAAVTAVRRGELVVLPTDTVYGIGADAFTPAAVDAPAGGQGPRPRHAGAGAGRHRARRARPGHGPRRVRPGPGRRVLAGRADPRLPGQPVAAVGPRRHPGHRRGPDAAAPGRPRAAQARPARWRCPAPTAPASRAATTADDAQEQLGDAVSVYLDGGPERRRRALLDRRPDRRRCRGCCARARSPRTSCAGSRRSSPRTSTTRRRGVRSRRSSPRHRIRSKTAAGAIARHR